MTCLSASRRNGALLPASALFGLALVVFGLCQAPPAEILSGLYTIFTMEDVLITDYIAVAGIGAAFVNAGLVTLISAASCLEDAAARGWVRPCDLTPERNR